MELTPSPVHMRSPEGVPHTCRRHKWMTLYLDSSSSLQSLPLCIRLSSRIRFFRDPSSLRLFFRPIIYSSVRLSVLSPVNPVILPQRINAKKNNENIKTNGNQKNSKNFSKIKIPLICAFLRQLF